MSEFFREAIEPESKPVEVTEHSDIVQDDVTPVETPPSLYREMGKNPLLLDTIKVPYHNLGVEEKANDIDKFISEEIKRQHLKDDKTTYNEILTKYLDKFTADDPFIQLDTLHKLIQVDKQLMDALKEKQRLELTDPTDLSAAELSELLKMKGINA